MSTQIHHRACNLCEAICGLEIKVENGEVTSIRGDKNDPLSRGHICPKAVALKDIYEDPDRLKQPVKKTANGWKTISWEKAFDEVETNLKRIQKKYGNAAIGTYYGNPNVHNYGSLMFGSSLPKALKTPNIFTATSADQLPSHFAGHQMFGHYFMIPVPDVDRTDFMLIIGANPLVSNGSLMTAPDFPKRMKAIRKRGKVMVIDPRRTETADKADEHFFIKPGTDALFLWSLIHCFFENKNINLRHLTDHVKNLDLISAEAKKYTPEKTAKITGISAENTRRIAREFTTAKSAVCYGRMGVSVQEFGGQCNWLIHVINIITGNFDRPGGAMFASPAMDTIAFGKKGKINRWKSRVSGRPERFGELPVAVMIEEMTTPGEGQIKAFITSAGNPVLSTPNGRALDKALDDLDFMVSIDIYINETTRHADIILPPTTGLETSHYDTAFHALAIRNTAKFSEPLFAKSDKQKHDYEIFIELTRRMTNGEYAPPLDSPEKMVAYSLSKGTSGVSFNDLKANPSGIDLGPLKSVLPNRLFTEDKKIELAPESLMADLPRLEQMLSWHDSKSSHDSREANMTAKSNSWHDFKSCQERSFQLISRRHLRSNNSWMHNSHRLVKGRERCTLLIHPNDATSAKIEDGQLVKITSRSGSIDITAEVSEEMAQGVVCIPHGWGHDREGVQMKTAKAHAGASVNDLTSERFIDEVTGNIGFSGIEVSVKVTASKV